MLFVASIVVTLPLFYIVAVGLLMYGLYIAATSSVIPDGLPLYATLAVGTLVLLCLLKPLARAAAAEAFVKRYPDRQGPKEPLLHRRWSVGVCANCSVRRSLKPVLCWNAPPAYGGRLSPRDARPS